MQSNNEKKCWCHCHCVGMNCPEVLDQTVSHTITVCKHCNAFYEDESCQPQNEAKDIRKAEILMVIKNNLDVLAQVGNDGTTLKETIMNDIKLLIQQPPPMTTHKQSEKECECYKDTSTGWFCPKHLPNGHLASRESTEEDKFAWQKELLKCETRGEGVRLMVKVIDSLLLQERQRAEKVIRDLIVFTYTDHVYVGDSKPKDMVVEILEIALDKILNPETN